MSKQIVFRNLVTSHGPALTKVCSYIAALQAQVKSLQSQLNTQQGQITTLQGQVGSLQTANTTLQGQLAAVQSNPALALGPFVAAVVQARVADEAWAPLR